MENEERIKELLTRGVERIYPNAEFLEQKLKCGEKLSVYFGIDPTGPTIHVGHAVNLLKLRAFQDLGHNIIILYGGFTAQIGDPTDKLATRQPLSSAQIKKNTVGYKKSVGKILDLKKTRFVDNETWSKKLTAKDIMNLAARFTVSQLLERDMFQERLKQGKEIHANEFLYPVFQAYDAVAMDVDVQLGGNDQTFNMLAGRTLMRKMKNKEKAVMSMKLLVDPSGKKMGKTEGNIVAFSDTPTDCFGKIMSWPDSMIVPGFELCTTVPLADVERVKKDLASGVNPKELKLKLAEAVVALIHGERESKKAHVSFDAAFTEGKPQEFVEIERSFNPVGVLIEKGIVMSKTELRRLIAAGAVTHIDSNEKVGEDFALTFPTGKYRIGKHRFVKII